MNTQKSNVPFGMICAVLCVLNVLRLLLGMFSNIVNGSFTIYSILNLLTTGCYIFMAVMLFMDRRDVLSVVGFGGLTFVSLISFLFYGNTILFLHDLLNLIAYGSLTFIVLASVTDYLPQFKAMTKKLWFVPFVASVASFAVYILYYANMGILRFFIFRLLWNLLSISIVLFAALWAVKGTPAPVSNSTAPRQTSTPSNDYGEGYISMGMHIALLLLTGGIWMYIWVYRITKYLNCVKGEEYRNPTTKLLLCMFIPFYYIYWTYKSAQRIDKLALSKGIPSDLSTLCLILAIFVGIVPPILMQDKINATCQPKPAAPIAPAAPVAPVAPVTPAAPAVDNIEQLKRYKELLDMGILTPEEFDAKKKQLLDL